MNRSAILAALTLGLTSLLSPPAAHAAGDGFYCTGRDYLAYQLNAAAPESGQRLHLIPFNAEQGMGAAREIPLDAFAVHGIRCLDKAVDLLAWNRIYRVDLRPQSPSPVSVVEPQPEDSELPDFGSDRLGPAANGHHTLPLPTATGPYRFELSSGPNGTVLREIGPLDARREQPLFGGPEQKTTDRPR